MAFVIQRPKTKTFTAVWKGPDGRQVRRVTSETSKRAAQAKANEWELEARKNAGAHHETHRAGLAILDQATRDLKSGHLDLQRTEELLLRLHKIANPEHQEPQVIPWFQSWIDSQRHHIGDSTLKGYGEDLALFKSAFGPKVSAMPLRELKPQEIEKALVKAKAAGRRGSTVNKAFVSFRRACKDALEKGLITRLPTTTVKALPTGDTKNVAPFSAEEVQAILRHATNNEWRGLITLASHTGLRMNDILKLNEKFISGTEIVLLPKKTVKYITVVKIPLSPPCLAWIAGKKGDFFPVLKKQEKSTTSMQFEKIRKAAGVPKEITVAGDQTATRSFHSLRHSFNSWLTEAGVSADVRMKLVGHRTEKMHAVYTHLPDEALDRAVGMLPNL